MNALVVKEIKIEEVVFLCHSGTLRPKTLKIWAFAIPFASEKSCYFTFPFPSEKFSRVTLRSLMLCFNLLGGFGSFFYEVYKKITLCWLPLFLNLEILKAPYRISKIVFQVNFEISFFQVSFFDSFSCFVVFFFVSLI